LLFSTAQIPDGLVIDGKQYAIFTNPLNDYLDKNPNKKIPHGIISSANWRGYIALWEIKDGCLQLKNIEISEAFPDSAGNGSHEIRKRSVLSEVFPGEKDIIADWFTGHLIIPDGKLVEYVHMGYASAYKKYVVLRIEKGKVTNKWKVNQSAFERFRKKQFEAFKTTDEYRSAFAKTKAESPDENEKEIERFLFEFYSERYLSLVFEGLDFNY
jgi:hypothetical protein